MGNKNAFLVGLVLGAAACGALWLLAAGPETSIDPEPRPTDGEDLRSASEALVGELRSKLSTLEEENRSLRLVLETESNEPGGVEEPPPGAEGKAARLSRVESAREGVRKALDALQPGDLRRPFPARRARDGENVGWGSVMSVHDMLKMEDKGAFVEYLATRDLDWAIQHTEALKQHRPLPAPLRSELELLYRDWYAAEVDRMFAARSEWELLPLAERDERRLGFGADHRARKSDFGDEVSRATSRFLNKRVFVLVK